MHQILRKSGAWPAVAVLLLALPLAAAAEPTKITFLHVNDVYEISPKRGQGGFAELMSLLKAERAAAQHSITTFGGDLISPSVMSGLTKGTQMIELMNAVGVDVAVPGNHEFDFGPEIAAQRIGESKFPWLGTNVLGRDGKPAAGMVDLHTVKAGDFTVGFFGLLAPETDTLSSPGGEISFASITATATTSVKKLQDMGADVIVALTHLDMATDIALAREVEGIHAILGGHDHDPIVWRAGSVPILKAGYDAHHLGALDLSVEWVESRGRKRLQVVPAWRLTSTAGVTPDSDIKAIVDGHNARLDEALNVPVGKVAVLLDSQRASVRTRETNIGNLIADAMRKAVGADIAITNGGGIRGDRTYDAGTVLTRKDVLTELPFGNVTVLLELSGADVVAALENGVSQVEKTAGRFPQVSGLSLVYDPAATAGSRVVSVKVGGAALDPAKIYRVATNDYMAGGGDGYAALEKGKALIDASGGTLMATTVMDYIAANAPVAPKAEGRITAK
ncbi:MAG: 5'-nucleotidase C-terminal domain-containing protein [Rhodospirillales bacterium]|nr:MAG: 5'-nucleotidase C-terminal domain-containing protein [Rhodospirillales bacterium]